MRPFLPFASMPLLASLFLAACGGDTPATNATNAAEPGTNSSQPSNTRSIGFEKDEVEFRYSWPADAAAIEQLDAWLMTNGDRLMKETRADAANEQAAAKAGGYTFTGYGYTEDWHVVANLPALLILQSEGYSFTGGAHGMPIVASLIWDKATNKRLETSALFDLAALAAAIRPRFCEALDAEREKRRGEPVERSNISDDDDADPFDQCVDPAKQTILPVAKAGKTLDTIRVVIMPYEAGPYAEGVYEIDLPLDRSALQTVKPAYKSSFSAL